jgi:hypothetical protein
LHPGPYPDTVLYVKRALLRPLGWAGFLAGIVVLGLGVPLAWLWIASQLESSLFQVHYGPLLVMVLGMLGTYLVAIELAARVDRRERGATPRRPMNWNRSLGAERRAGDRATTMERLFITATVAVAIAFEVWLFLFAGSSLPGQ